MPDAIQFSVSVADVKLDPVALAAFLRSDDGPLYRRMFALGDEAKAVAVRNAPVSKPDTSGIPYRNPKPAPGRLRDSIVKRVGTDGRGVYVRVGTVGVEYAMWVHEGTQPHDIGPRKAKSLVFQGRSGAVVFAQHVNHPGNQPNRWLIRTAVEMVGAGNVVQR